MDFPLNDRVIHTFSKLAKTIKACWRARSFYKLNLDGAVRPLLYGSMLQVGIEPFKSLMVLIAVYEGHRVQSPLET
jgi:hypothetical protein